MEAVTGLSATSAPAGSLMRPLGWCVENGQRVGVDGRLVQEASEDMQMAGTQVVAARWTEERAAGGRALRGGCVGMIPHFTWLFAISG